MYLSMIARCSSWAHGSWRGLVCSFHFFCEAEGTRGFPAGHFKIWAFVAPRHGSKERPLGGSEPERNSNRLLTTSISTEEKVGSQSWERPFGACSWRLIFCLNARQVEKKWGETGATSHSPRFARHWMPGAVKGSFHHFRKLTISMLAPE